jgi:hypothetical protein
LLNLLSLVHVMRQARFTGCEIKIDSPHVK